MRHALLTAALVLLTLAAPARADDFSDEIPAGAGGLWQVGIRVGAEFHVGEIGSTYYLLKPRYPVGLFGLFIPDAEQLHEGPDVTGFVEYTLSDHFRVGFEAGAQVAVIGEAFFEEHFTTIVWGPYLRVVAFPGKPTPYGILAGQIYHGFAGGSMSALAQPIGLTWAGGGGLELPLTPDVAISFEGRFRQYEQGGTDPKIVEALLVTQFWLK